MQLINWQVVGMTSPKNVVAINRLCHTNNKWGNLIGWAKLEKLMIFSGRDSNI